MAEVEVKLLLPVDGRTITVELDDTMTPGEIVNELVSADVIPADQAGYQLAVKGGPVINENQQLKDVALGDDPTIRIVPATDAG